MKLRLSKSIYIPLLTFFFLSSYSCVDKKKEMKDNSILCLNDSIINFNHEKINSKDSEIIYRNNKEEKLLDFTINTVGNSLSITPPINFSSKDTLVIKVNL
jgi:hypothetical protein